MSLDSTFSSSASRFSTHSCPLGYFMAFILVAGLAVVRVIFCGIGWLYFRLDFAAIAVSSLVLVVVCVFSAGLFGS